MISMKKLKRILELGIVVGFLLILMYEVVGIEFEIIIIECDEKMIEFVIFNLEKFDLSYKIKIEKGDCLEILEKLNELFDFIFMDVGKGYYNYFLFYCLRLLN